ncbi:hypothetical protein DSECCO2_497650 [anaerobic digester metagenome]
MFLEADVSCFEVTSEVIFKVTGCLISTFLLFLRKSNSFESMTITTAAIRYSVAGDAAQTPFRSKKWGRIKSRGKRKMNIFPRWMKSAALTLLIDW